MHKDSREMHQMTFFFFFLEDEIVADIYFLKLLYNLQFFYSEYSFYFSFKTEC